MHAHMNVKFIILHKHVVRKYREYFIFIHISILIPQHLHGNKRQAKNM
jgi:hypothetical protein